MLTKLNPFVFVSAFAVGMLFIYVTTPAPEVVIKYPTPWNAGNIIYKHETADTCFVYNASKTSCPDDTSLIRPQPIIS